MEWERERERERKKKEKKNKEKKETRQKVAMCGGAMSFFFLFCKSWNVPVHFTSNLSILCKTMERLRPLFFQPTPLRPRGPIP